MDKKERDEKIELYGRGFELLMLALREIPFESWKFKPEPKEWSVHEVLIHLADSETNGALRARKLATEPGGLLMGYDQDKWATDLNYHDQNPEAAFYVVKYTRQRTYEWLKTLPDEVFTHSVRHPEYEEPYTFEQWINIYSSHIPGHIEQIKNNYALWKLTNASATVPVAENELTYMKTEKEKMLSGEFYNSQDPQLAAERRKARLLMKELNESRDDQEEYRARVLKELIPGAAGPLWLEPPFYCDYGTNITIAPFVFFNFNCTILDVAPVKIGSGCMFGPNVQIYTATHPLSPALRREGGEFGKPIEIGDDVWLGGGVIVCPGVKIGSGAVIGAGSVVTKDIPEKVFAAGNPCRVIREIEE